MSRSRVVQLTDIRDIANAIAAVEAQVALAEGGESPPQAGATTRRALRRIASGVTVLTLNQDGLRHGATVSAIVPVSRDPLVIGVCLRVSSAFAQMVGQARSFSVNVLAAGQASIARRFADPTRRPGDAQFTGLRWTTDQVTGAPLINGCLAHLACRLTGSHRIGDHDLIVADVITGVPGPGIPLLSFAGKLNREGAAGPPAFTPVPTHPGQERHASQRQASSGTKQRNEVK